MDTLYRPYVPEPLAPLMVTIAPTSFTQECWRDGCHEPLTIANPGITYDATDPDAAWTARGLAGGLTFIHGTGERARTRIFTFEQIVSGEQADWIHDCHEEGEVGEKLPADKAGQVPDQDATIPPAPARAPAKGREDAGNMPVADHHFNPLREPDPRRTGPAPNRRVKPQ